MPEDSQKYAFELTISNLVVFIDKVSGCINRFNLCDLVGIDMLVVWVHLSTNVLYAKVETTVKEIQLVSSRVQSEEKDNVLICWTVPVSKLFM